MAECLPRNDVSIFDIYSRKYMDKSDPLNNGRTVIVRMEINGLPLRLQGYGKNNDEAFRDLIKVVATTIDRRFLEIATLAAPVATAHSGPVACRGRITHEDLHVPEQAATASPSRSPVPIEQEADRDFVASNASRPPSPASSEPK